MGGIGTIPVTLRKNIQITKDVLLLCFSTNKILCYKLDTKVWLGQI